MGTGGEKQPDLFLINTWFFLANPSSLYASINSAKRSFKSSWKFLVNHPVKVIWVRIWLLPFVNSQRFPIDPSPIFCCCIYLQTNKPFTIFTAFSVLNRVFDKFPFLLCFHHHKVYFVVYTVTTCLWPRVTSWLVIKAITRTQPLSIYIETKTKKIANMLFQVLSTINNRRGREGSVWEWINYRSNFLKLSIITEHVN